MLQVLRDLCRGRFPVGSSGFEPQEWCSSHATQSACMTESRAAQVRPPTSCPSGLPPACMPVRHTQALMSCTVQSGARPRAGTEWTTASSTSVSLARRPATAPRKAGFGSGNRRVFMLRCACCAVHDVRTVRCMLRCACLVLCTRPDDMRLPTQSRGQSKAKK